MGVAVAAALACAPPAAARPAPSHSITKHYQVGDCGNSCSNVEVDPPLGWLGWDNQTVLFTAGTSDRVVTITVRDTTGTVVPFAVDGAENQPGPFFDYAHCGAATFAIEPGTTIRVYPFSVYASVWHVAAAAVCPGAATSGSITATFRR
jgi:hypothetical protein